MIRKGLGDDALYLIIHLKNLRGYILIFESFHVNLALANHFFAVFYRRKDSSGIAVDIVWTYIKAIWTTSFLQTTTCSSYDWQSTLYSFDNWNTKTLIT